MNLSTRLLPLLLLLQLPGCGQAQSPDIRTVKPDLTIPKMTNQEPGPGLRVRQTVPGWPTNDVYHTLYLPTDYRPDATKKHPVIIEFAGNGGYSSKWGDVSTGVPEGSNLGYGMSAGQGFIWVCAPFVSADKKKVATRWWGDKPDWDPRPTVEYCQKLVPWICKTYGGDAERVVLVGFSRGAIAVNRIGLHDDEIAKLWCGFVAYSHYDGVWKWGWPGSDRKSALQRLKRLGNRPQFICHEHTTPERGLQATRRWIESTKLQGRFTFVETGFRNHNDAWVLRPSPARTALRKWLGETTK